MKVLVVKMSSMGDVVHAQPLATDIRRHFPQASIDWVCEAPFASIPAMNPAVSQVIPIAWRKWRRNLRDAEARSAMTAFRSKLRSTRYDWVLDCQGLVKSALVTRLARTGDRAGPDWRSSREPLASLAYRVKASVPRGLHVVTRNRMIGAAALGYLLDDPPRFGLQAPAYRPQWLYNAEATAGNAVSLHAMPLHAMPLHAMPSPATPPPALPPYAVLVTGASRPQKLWPDDHWVEVGLALRDRGYRLVWLWGSDAELARARRLAAACGTVDDVRARDDGATTGSLHVSALRLPESIIPPFLTVAEASGLLASSGLVVGLDTGFTHLAGALGRSTIGIFCDFDATQCAVSGDGFCASFGGVGQVPSTREVKGALDAALSGDAPVRSAPCLDTSTQR